MRISIGSGNDDNSIPSPPIPIASGDPDGADLARCVPPGVPADRRPDWLHHRPARLQPACAGPHHPQPAGRDAGGTPAMVSSSPEAGGEAEPVHLLVDSTGLKLCGPGEGLLEKHGTRTRRSWRKLHLGVDADTGQIVATALTTNDVDDGFQAGPLLDQVAGPVASFTGDGAVAERPPQAGRRLAPPAERHPEAAVVVPPRATATSSTSPTTGVWPGRKRPGPRNEPGQRPPSADGN